MKKIIKCILLYCLLMLTGCQYHFAPILDGNFDSKTGHNAHYICETTGYIYEAGMASPWQPIGDFELLGFCGLGFGCPVYGFRNDVERYYIYIGKISSNATRTGYCHRTDVYYPSISEATINGVQLVKNNEEICEENAQKDRTLIQDISMLLEAKPKLIETYTNDEGLYRYNVKYIGRLWLFCDELPGCGVFFMVFLFNGSYYMQLDIQDGQAQCVLLPDDTFRLLVA